VKGWNVPRLAVSSSHSSFSVFRVCSSRMRTFHVVVTCDILLSGPPKYRNFGGCTSVLFLGMQRNLLLVSIWKCRRDFVMKYVSSNAPRKLQSRVPRVVDHHNAAFLKLWSADHKWSSGSALVVLLDWTLVKKNRKNKTNLNCVSHSIAENLKQSLEITYNKRL